MHINNLVVSILLFLYFLLDIVLLEYSFLTLCTVLQCFVVHDVSDALLVMQVFASFLGLNVFLIRKIGFAMTVSFENVNCRYSLF